MALPDIEQIKNAIPMLDKLKELFDLIILMSDRLFMVFKNLFGGFWGIFSGIFGSVLQFTIDLVRFLMGYIR
ncbi:hypothetical protein HZC33_03125 [Candidatus Wolfebacteria bacterium]|nr:hypothetical protein [Candidatus Wolfebacteria bacterium]